VRIARVGELDAFAFAMSDAFAKVQLRHGRPLIVPIAKPTVWAGLAELPLVGPLYARLTGGKGLYVGHYVTLVGFDDEHYYLLDPADGRRKVAQGALARMRAGFGNAGILVARQERKEP